MSKSNSRYNGLGIESRRKHNRFMEGHIVENHDQYIRVAALAHDALGITRVKVIFRDGGHDTQGGQEAAYFMDRETYRQIELGTKATLADYKKLSANIQEAQNIDIYSNQ